MDSTKTRPRINVRALRASKSFTQRELADRMDVAVTTVVQWDRGAQPSAPMLPQMASVFGCSIEALYETSPEDE